MSCSDPIADALTVIRNGLRAGKSQVKFPYSKIKHGLVEVLQKQGYLTRVDVLDTQPAKTIQVGLKYAEGGEAVIHAIDRVSRPGRRLYSNAKDMHPVINGFGSLVVSTSKGVLSDADCRAQKVGGEVLCEVK